MERLTPRKILFLVLGVIALILTISFAGSIGEEVSAGEIVVIQKPVTGKLEVHTTPGWVWQSFGTATHYKKSFQFWFSNKDDQGNEINESIKVRFNDGGHANVSGSVRADLPLDEKSILTLHSTFGSQASIEQQLIRTVIEKSLYMTGPLMSSAESYAEKRNSLLAFIEDQAVMGVYKTIVKTIKTVDPLTNQEKTTSVVEIVEKDGKILRQEVSPLMSYHIKLSGLSINAIDYDATVEKQIASQQNAIMQVQTAIANSKKAEQDALTIEQQGKAAATKAKWEQEVIKTQAVTEAQQKLEVQKLAAQTAELYKKQMILEGEGDASKKRLVMQANGALEQKLEAWVESQKVWADAFAKYQGNVVPQIQTGGSGGSNNGAVDFMQLMGIKAAKDLSLDFKNK